MTTRQSYFGMVSGLVLFLPTFPSIIGNAGVLVVNGFAVVFIFIYIAIVDRLKIGFFSKLEKKQFSVFFLICLGFHFLMPFSMLTGLIIGNIHLQENDFYEFYRLIFYPLVFIFSYRVFREKNAAISLEKFLGLVFIVVVLLSLNQIFRIFDFVSELYTRFGNIHTGRVTAPFGNPYDAAFFLSFFVFYYWVKAIFRHPMFIFQFVLALGLLFLTQSRSVVFTAMFFFVLIMPLLLGIVGFCLKRLTINKNVINLYIALFFSLAFVASLSAVLIENLPFLTGQLLVFLETGQVGSSGEARWEQFEFALDKAANNILILVFGNGPAKGVLVHVESIYTYWFFRYGLIGLFGYLFSLFISIVLVFRVIGSIGIKNPSSCLFLAILCWLCAIPLMSIGNNFTEQVKLSFFYDSLLGFVFASFYRIKSGLSV